MFHNYFFLKRLAKGLDRLLKGKELLECFSQNKDELILGFTNDQQAIYIRANLIPQIGLLQIVDDFKRARKNSVDIFNQLIGAKVEAVNVFQYERSFWIDFNNNQSLVFKMHGSRSNILLTENNQVLRLFRSKLENDRELIPSELYKNIDLSFERFRSAEANPSKFLPALGKEVKKYLQGKKYQEQDLDTKWTLLSNTLSELENNPIYIYTIDDKPFLSLLKVENPTAQFEDPIKACNDLYIRFTKWHYLQEARNKALKPLEDQIKKTENYIENTEAKLLQVLDRRGYDEIANIIMANLNIIPKGSKKVSLQDFYNNTEIEIKLNPELSPQKNAENLYRKAKNQNLEIANLEGNIESRKTKLEQLKKQLKKVQATEEIKALRNAAPATQGSKREILRPYHTYEILGYQVLVGKNAKHNDELTLKIANKNDMWLHAKDVPGSHVIIKDKAGKNLPKNVLEMAAQLAAWFSKRKTDSLCPVIYTPKKYVRKRKGDPPGAVVVEKEDVIMVIPKNYDNQTNI